MIGGGARCVDDGLSFLTPIGGRLPAETRRSHFGNRAIESSSIHQREAKGECPSTSRERRFHFGKSCGPPRSKASKTTNPLTIRRVHRLSAGMKLPNPFVRDASSVSPLSFARRSGIGMIIL